MTFILYQEYDEEISKAAIDSFRAHLYYLGEELITLSLFSNNVSTATKNKMRGRFNNGIVLPNRMERSLKFIMTTSTEFQSLELHDFIGTRSHFLFQILDIEPDFLNHDAITWEYIESYKSIQKLIEQTIVVINDGAERILGLSDNIIRTQKARKKKYFQNLTISKFDKNKR